MSLLLCNTLLGNFGIGAHQFRIIDIASVLGGRDTFCRGLHPNALGKAAQTMQAPRQEQDVCPDFAGGLTLAILSVGKCEV